MIYRGLSRSIENKFQLLNQTGMKKLEEQHGGKYGRISSVCKMRSEIELNWTKW